MKIDMPEKDRLEFRLDNDDLTRLGISFEALDYSNIETKRVVWTLIDIARNQLNADFDLTGRLLVEVFPDRAHNGCRMCITALQKKARSITIIATQMFTPHIFELNSTDDLLDLAQQLKKLPVNYDDGELFRSGDKYRLIIPLADSQHKLTAVLHEYAQHRGTDEVTLAHTREHWLPVVTQKALKAIRLGS